MANSGYIMVDVTGLDVSEGGEQTVPGLYQRLIDARATGKAVMLTGAVNGDSEISPSFVTVTEGAGETFTLGAFTAIVADDDTVTPAGG